MSQQGKNLRLRRTQKLLCEALVELIDERGFDAITIGELTSRAMVSLAAFYRNYQDKYDLVEQIFEEAMSALLSAIGDLGREHPPEIWVTFFEHIAEYERLLILRRLRDWIAQEIEASLRAAFAEADSTIPLDVLANYLAGSRSHWCNGGCRSAKPTPPKTWRRRSIACSAAIRDAFGLRDSE